MRLSPAETRNDAGSAFPAGHTPGLFTPSLRHSDTPGFAPFLSNITEVSAAWPRFAFRHVPMQQAHKPYPCPFQQRHSNLRRRAKPIKEPDSIPGLVH